MISTERKEIADFSWGVYAGFPFLFARKLVIPAILHIVILVAAAAVIFGVYNSNSESVKWAILPFAIVEMAFLTFYGTRAGRMSWTSCRWKSPYKFISSNGVWGLFGRILIFFRILNAIGMFLQRPGGLKPYPSWFIPVGLTFFGMLLLFAIWRSRGPIWAVALNSLKESVAKLEVVILFLISLIFVILFNAIWLLPAVRDPVLTYFEENQKAADMAAGLSNVSDDESASSVSRRVDVAFTDTAYKAAFYRPKVQAAAFFFGEFFIALICFALGISLVAGEIQRGVVLTVLPKPIGRGEYIIGKILGGWIIATACFEVIAIISIGFALPYSGHTFGNIPNIFHAMLFMPVKYAILLALIIYFSLWLPEAVAGFSGLVIFIAGHMSEKILDLATDDFAAIPILSQALKAVHVMLPNLAAVMSPMILDPDATEFISTGPMVEWTLWALLYFAVIACLTVFTFRKRSL